MGGPPSERASPEPHQIQLPPLDGGSGMTQKATPSSMAQVRTSKARPHIPPIVLANLTISPGQARRGQRIVCSGGEHGESGVTVRGRRSWPLKTQCLRRLSRVRPIDGDEGGHSIEARGCRRGRESGSSGESMIFQSKSKSNTRNHSPRGGRAH